MPILEIIDATKAYGGVLALDKLSLKVAQNQIISIIGPNGSGKTTLFNIISGFAKPTAGQIIFNGNNITEKKPEDILLLGIARTFQNIRIFPQMSVLDNILMGTNIRGYETLSAALLRRSWVESITVEKKASAEISLRRIGLENKVSALGKELSHGQSRLVEMARAIATKPRLLLLDEPTAGLHQAMVDCVRSMILDAKSLETTILIIEHNIDFVMSISDWIIVLDCGKMITEGLPSQIREDDLFARTYFGYKT